jgi:ATP-dependent RNA helicase RhlE
VTFNDLNLNTPLLNALSDLEYFSPTPIQSKTFSVIMSGADMVGIAQTGTGKTFAYLLPILRQLKYSEQKNPRILIVVPTRELVLQVVSEIEKLSKYITLRVEGVYGGTNINTQKKLVYKGLDIIVATPGRLFDILMTGLLRLNQIQKLVIDEVDEMLNLGFRPQLVNIIENLPKKRQNLMFSATLSQDVDNIISDFFINPIKIEVSPHGTPLEKIEQKIYLVPNFNTKLNLLNILLENEEEYTKILVFAGSKKSADRIFANLPEKYTDKSGVIHSNKSQNLRFGNLNKFISGENRILIATDIAARGLDIQDVSHVINFDAPENPGDYIHRIGRTGRAEKDGVAITFVSEKEEEFISEIEKLMKRQIPVEQLPEGIKVSQTLQTFEKEPVIPRGYGKKLDMSESQGAFHQKSEKKLKQNSGSPSKKRKPAKRSKKKK